MGSEDYPQERNVRRGTDKSQAKAKDKKGAGLGEGKERGRRTPGSGETGRSRLVITGIGGPKMEKQGKKCRTKRYKGKVRAIKVEGKTQSKGRRQKKRQK